MKSIFPIVNPQVFIVRDVNTYTGQVPPATQAWDTTLLPLNFPISVPRGERWLVHFAAESYIAGPNAPTYNCAFGVVLRGATKFDPALWGGPGSYGHVITTAGDAAWGSTSIPIWLNPGITVCNFGLARDAGAITVMRRMLNAIPYLGMKI